MMMKMILLLVSAAAMLSASAIPRNSNLVTILNQWDTHKNTTDYKDHMVENVKEMAYDCLTDYNVFFCKVYEILHKHDHFNKTSKGWEELIVRNLRAFITSQNQTCAVVLKNANTAPTSVTIPRLIDDLEHCIQTFNMGSKRSP